MVVSRCWRCEWSCGRLAAEREERPGEWGCDSLRGSLCDVPAVCWRELLSGDSEEEGKWVTKYSWKCRRVHWHWSAAVALGLKTEQRAREMLNGWPR